MRGHNLCWHESVPGWIRKIDNKDEIKQIFVDHITTVCKHYAGKLQSWDVVNEAIDPNGKLPGGLRKSFWYDNLGPDYIDLAFHTAREADPNVKLDLQRLRSRRGTTTAMRRSAGSSSKW